MNTRRRYPRKQRLGTAEIVTLLSGVRIIKRSGFSISFKENPLGVSRLGLVVPKRAMPRAIDRNRVKRVVREWFRNSQIRLGSRDFLVRITRKSVTMGDLEECLTVSAWPKS